MDKQVMVEMNEQINFELYSGYIYLELGLIMEKQNYKGFSSWLMEHYKEELEHASDFIDFMIKRGVTPTLHDIKMEKFDVTEPVDVAKIIYEHEQKVTKRVFDLHDVAKKANDYATEIFMHSYICEQIEEEDTTQDILDSFTLAGDNVAAKLIIDREFLHKKRCRKQHGKLHKE